MTATYAGIPVDELRYLPDDTRTRLLHRLEADCAAAAHRNAIVLARRAEQAEADQLDAILAADPVPPMVAALRQRQMLAEVDACNVRAITKPRRTA